MSQLRRVYSRSFGLLLLVTAALSGAVAQQNAIPSLGDSKPGATIKRLSDLPEPPAAPKSPARIISDFIATEAKLREALNHHTFKRDVVLQTIGPDGAVTGEYIRNSQFVFDDRGNRIERVLYHPKPTIREMRITKEDIQDLAGAQLLGLDVFESGKYQLTFAGRETLNSSETYAIDVAPRQAPDPNHMSQRFFVGRVWIDPTTSQIVKVQGIVEPRGKQRFPAFKTWREQTGKFVGFPTRTEADDVLHFPRVNVHYRIRVRYYDYKRFASKVSVTEANEPPAN